MLGSETVSLPRWTPLSPSPSISMLIRPAEPAGAARVRRRSSSTTPIWGRSPHPPPPGASGQQRIPRPSRRLGPPLSTYPPRRRIRQHNGEIWCGAWRAKRGRPWEMVLCIHGFPSNVTAL